MTRNLDQAFSDKRRRLLSIGLAAAGAMAARLSRAVERNDSDQAATPKPTYLVVYRRGPAWIEGEPLSGQPLQPHGRYMLDLYRRGLLQFAGGFADDSGGAAAFQADDDAHAAALIAADPAVSAGIFGYELRRWRLQPWEKLARKK